MRVAATVATILMLAACSGGDGGNAQDPANAAGNEAAGDAGGNASGGETGGSDAASVSLQPGQWETTVQVTSMSVANMPQGVSPPTPPPTTVRSCITPEQAARPNANFLTGSGDTGGCTYQNFSMNGGRLQGSVSCTNQGATMRSTFEGQFTPSAYEMTTQVETEANGMTMNMATRTTARRVGDCPAG